MRITLLALTKYMANLFFWFSCSALGEASRQRNVSVSDMHPIHAIGVRTRSDMQADGTETEEQAAHANAATEASTAGIA